MPVTKEEGKSYGIAATDYGAAAAKALVAGFGGKEASEIASILIDEFLVLRDEADVGDEMICGVPLQPNKHFKDHGLEEGNSEYTKKYVISRKLKNIAGGLVSVGGALASPSTGGVNVGGAVRHGAADINTIAHLYKLTRLAKKFRQSETTKRWCAVVFGMKLLKFAGRSAQAGSSGANAIAGAIVDASVTATNRLALTAMEKHTSNTAQALHWRAYQEQFFLANKAFADGSGPATDIVKEILRRRAHCVFGGQYDWRRIIQEPAGWLVIHDKISLL